MKAVKYRYTAELSYIDGNKKENYIDPSKITSILIDYNYEEYNTPILVISVNINKTMLDDIIINAEKNSMIFGLYKYIVSDNTNATSVQSKKEYFKKEFLYLIYEEPNKNKELEKNNTDGQTLFKNVTLGLIDKECSNSRKKIINGVIEGNLSSIVFNYLGDRPILMEPFPNNITTTLILPPMTSTTQLISYMNKTTPFYNTQYRLFYDFKRTYLISSSGKCVPIKDITRNSIHINISKRTDVIGKYQGMYEIANGIGYEIYADEGEVSTVPNKLNGKLYTAIAGVSAKGQKSILDLNINKDDNILDNVMLERVHHENLNQVQSMKNNIELSTTLLGVNKAEIDGSALTINNEYTVTHETIKDYTGIYLLANKKEVYMPDGTSGQFISNVTLSLRKIMS